MMVLMADYGKVYIFGKRIHHGLVGYILYQIGFKEVGKILMENDKADLTKWFRCCD
jgi:hypothetical protein